VSGDSRMIITKSFALTTTVQRINRFLQIMMKSAG
jgi:hypothetical protein